MRTFTHLEISILGVEKYRKTALTSAQVLVFNGTFETLEGPKSFVKGDYLCIGVQGEAWPMKKASFEADKEYVKESRDGFRVYRTKSLKNAVFIPEQFTLQLDGEPMVSKPEGGYIVYGGNPARAWICDKDIFEESYKLERTS